MALILFSRPDLDDMNPDFAYSTLDPVRREIRLLQLLPNIEDDAQIECELTIACLSAQLVYGALSYTWGDQSQTSDITINQQSFTVSHQLETILRTLRPQDETYTIWIDAICINQNQTEAALAEKSSQIPLMQDVYALAAEVVVWLGDAEADNDKAFHILEHIQMVDELGEAIYLEGMRALSNILERPYWTRAWTFQELALAKRATVHCGGHSIDWSAFKGLYKFLMRMMLNRTGRPAQHGVRGTVLARLDRKEFLYMVQMKESVEAGDRLPLRALLAATASRKSSEPRDRVYSLLGLATDGRSVLPDYRKPVEEVYIEATRNVISGSTLLDSLQLHEPRTKRANLPSWCVDFDAGPGMTRPHFYGRRRVSQSIIEWGRHKSSFANQGLVISRVVHAATYERAPGSKDEFSRVEAPPSLQAWKQELESSQTATSLYGGLQRSKAAFYLCLTGGTGQSNKDTTFVVSDHDAVVSAAERWFSIPPPSHNDGNTPVVMDVTSFGFDGDVTSYRANATRHVLGRAFFITDSGFFGLGPGHLQEGDKLAILSAASTPIVLREQQRQPKRYSWIGAAYVPGLMDADDVDNYKAATGRKFRRIGVV